MAQPEIVVYESHDQLDIEAFFSRVWRGTHFPFDPENAHSDLRRISAVYQSNEGGFWLMQAAQVIGTVAIRPLSETVAELKRLNVSQSHRRQGLGARLVRHAVAHAGDGGFHRVRLDTIRTEHSAVHLVRTCGFVEISRYNENAEADVFMELNLLTVRPALGDVST